MEGNNLDEFPTFDQYGKEKSKRARRRGLPGLGATEVRSGLPAAGTSSIRRNYHSHVEMLAI